MLESIKCLFISSSSTYKYRMYKIIILLAVLLIKSSNAAAISWVQIRNDHVLLFDQFFHDRDDVNELEPRTFVYSTRGTLISGIQVVDLTGNEGGTVEIQQGGVHHTFVKMKLIPNRHRLLLNVEIFGVHDDRDDYF
ncbi:hypothetical protein ACKWTF_009623 [Chironomus riparius]